PPKEHRELGRTREAAPHGSCVACAKRRLAEVWPREFHRSALPLRRSRAATPLRTQRGQISWRNLSGQLRQGEWKNSVRLTRPDFCIETILSIVKRISVSQGYEDESGETTKTSYPLFCILFLYSVLDTVGWTHV